MERGGGLGLLHKLGLKAHCAHAVDLAVDVMVAFDKADVPGLGAALYDEG
jgi:hypothetical protein